MSKKQKDEKLDELRQDISVLTNQVNKEKDPVTRYFIERRLDRAKSDLARYLQNKPE